MEPTSAPPWMPTADRLRVAVERLVAAAQPKQIILFGSYARGDADDHSDIDLLVVSEQEFDHRSAMPGTVEHAARREGWVLYAV